MKALVYEEFGGPDVLALRDVDEPVASGDRVLIEVAAAGVNPFDWKIRRGYFASFFDHAFPIVTGMDVAGVVKAVGPDVTRVSVGDRVFGMNFSTPLRHGSYAELTLAPQEVLAILPEPLSFTQGAALPMAGLTAHQALRGLEAGQQCLIQAGAGGVGSIAIQLAKRAGATVYTTASKRNHDYVTELGADVVIDYASQDFAATITQPLDLILDSIGGESLEKSYDLLAPDGTLVCLVQPPDAARYDGRMFGAKASGDDLGVLATLFANGTLTAPPIQTRPLAEAAQAQADSESGHTRGKLVISINGR